MGKLENKGNDYFRSVVFIAITFIFAGIALLLCAESYIKDNIFKHLSIHIGVSLILVGFVMILIELYEIKNIIEKRLKDIMKENVFLEKLNKKELEKIIRLSFNNIINKTVTNKNNEFDKFFHYLIEQVLQLSDKCYRANYTEVIECKFLTIKEFNELYNYKIDAQESGIEEIIVYDNKLDYDVISPFSDREIDFPIDITWIYKKIKSIPKENYLTVKLYVNGQPQDLQLIYNDDGYEILIKMNHSIKVSKSAHIRIESKDFESGLASSVSSNMSHLTKEMQIHFSSNIGLDFETKLYASDIHVKQIDVSPIKMEHSVTILYNHWMLPGDGYALSWKRKKT